MRLIWHTERDSEHSWVESGAEYAKSGRTDWSGVVYGKGVWKEIEEDCEV